MSDPRHDLGRRAEAAVARWLEARGWVVLATRWRCPAGELDLVVQDPAGWLVGVEVRARRGGRAGSPEESVSRRHLGRLRAALLTYARDTRADGGGRRIDVVTLKPGPSAARWRLRHLHGVDAAWPTRRGAW